MLKAWSCLIIIRQFSRVSNSRKSNQFYFVALVLKQSEYFQVLASFPEHLHVLAIFPEHLYMLSIFPIVEFIKRGKNLVTFSIVGYKQERNERQEAQTQQKQRAIA